MDNDRFNLLFQFIALTREFDNFQFDFDSEYYLDEDVIDCQFKLYMLLLVDNEKEQDKMFKDFEEAYKKLSKEKREYIKRDLKKIFEDQDKNYKEKEKKL